MLSSVGKAGSRKSTWFNMKDPRQDKYISVDFSKLQGWKNIGKEVLMATQVNGNV